MSNRAKKSNNIRQRRNAFIALIGVLFAGFICMSMTVFSARWIVGSFRGDRAASTESTTSWTVDSAELTIAVSPLMAPVMEKLAADFNDLGMQTPDGKSMSVQLLALAPDKIIAQSLRNPSFQAISPDSSLWLDRLEQQWSEAMLAVENEDALPIGQRRTSGHARYAVSPVVLVAWENVARDLGWPGETIGWQDIQQKATEDPSFKWNHASTNTASGLLATLAEFYAGANLVRGLTEEAATAQETLDYVEAVESTVRFYGEGEDVIIERLRAEGQGFLDLFVGQERVVIDWNAQNPGERLIALYPEEGTLWTDHPLALLELGGHPDDLPVTNNQRLAYAAFADYLTSPEIQQRLLQAGYRPSDTNIPLDAAGSPFADTDAVDWRQPQTTLQMPSAAVVEVVLDAWRYTKKPTNVYLIVDSSGSMDGEKIERTQEALRAFVAEVQGVRDEVGMVEFATEVKSFTPLRVLDDAAKRDMVTLINNVQASGGTALIDAVYAAVVDLQTQGDAEAINAVVVMTDGQDNESYRSLQSLRDLLTDRRSENIVVFTIAFGEDADDWLLMEMANSGRGQFRRASETDIEELYRIISTYF